MIREVGVFADRADISEEIVRLRSHLKQFELIMATEKSAGQEVGFPDPRAATGDEYDRLQGERRSDRATRRADQDEHRTTARNDSERRVTWVDGHAADGFAEQ